MNFGRSLNARDAIRDGRGPASLVAKWIGHGCTAAWIARYVESREWHHSQANLGGSGRPTDYYEREDVLAAWLACCVQHKRELPVGRLDSLRRLRRTWHVAPCDVRTYLEQPMELPTPRSRKAADPLVGQTVEITRRYSTRTSSRRNRYVWREETLRGVVAAASDTFLTIDGRRIGRSTVQRLSVVTG